MIRHPLLTAVAVADILSLLLWLAAASTAFQILTKWMPQSTDREQIRLERRAETAGLSAKFSITVFFLSTVLFIVGITNVLAEIVPGAMCGTGVLQATDGLGGQAILYRFIALFLMVLWLTCEKLNLSCPQAPLIRHNSRILLLALPFFLSAVITTLRGILRIHSHHPVDCCTMVYDQLGSPSAVRQIAGIPDVFWIWTFWSLTILMILCAVWSLRTKSAELEKATGWLAVITLVWVPMAVATLLRVYAAYFYQVLHHHCPWCLFLPEHKFVGLPLFGALAVVSLEGPISYLMVKTAANHPDLAPAARRRSGLSALRLLLAIVAYTGMVALPGVYWKLRFGVWIG